MTVLGFADVLLDELLQVSTSFSFSKLTQIIQMF